MAGSEVRSDASVTTPFRISRPAAPASPVLGAAPIPTMTASAPIRVPSASRAPVALPPLTVISAMHDLSLAGQFADRLLLLDRGRIVADGPAPEVLSEKSIAAHYGASVRVLREGGAIFVLPRREART